MNFIELTYIRTKSNSVNIIFNDFVKFINSTDEIQKDEVIKELNLTIERLKILKHEIEIGSKK